jgi:hypothetical protein
MAILRPLLAAALAAACSRPDSPFVRITADDGRVYYADTTKTIHSESGGFLAFRDLVTREGVRLKNGSFKAEQCPPNEVQVRQDEYLADPKRLPRAEDYEPPP